MNGAVRAWQHLRRFSRYVAKRGGRPAGPAPV